MMALVLITLGRHSQFGGVVNYYTMTLESLSMTERGRDKAVTGGEILQLMRKSPQPVWSISNLADELGVSRPTVKNRIDELQEGIDIQSMDVGNTTAYYLSTDNRNLALQKGAEDEEVLKDNLRLSLMGRFIGTEKVWPEREHGYEKFLNSEKAQLVVEGGVSDWNSIGLIHEDDFREELDEAFTSPDKAQGLVTGRLVTRPATPICHFDPPKGADLEKKAQEDPEMWEPSNNALFLVDITVDDISPKEEQDDMLNEMQRLQEEFNGSFEDM